MKVEKSVKRKRRGMTRMRTHRRVGENARLKDNDEEKNLANGTKVKLHESQQRMKKKDKCIRCH